jgi:hypothetical protein
MPEEYLRYSRLTGKKYNVFDCIKIFNLDQSIAYMNNGVMPVDIKIAKGRTDRPVLVFYFVKDETKDVYERWVNHELEVIL